MPATGMPFNPSSRRLRHLPTSVRAGPERRQEVPGEGRAVLPAPDQLEGQGLEQQAAFDRVAKNEVAVEARAETQSTPQRLTGWWAVARSTAQAYRFSVEAL